MPVYRTRPGTTAYGYCVGILLLDVRSPFVPGDVGNATTYDYPVLYRTVPGATGRRVSLGDPDLEEAVVEAARELEAEGVKGISSDCAFFINYQDLVAKAVNVPVFLSSLLQIPFISSFLGTKRSVGLITANSDMISNRVIELSGIDRDRSIVIKGMQDEEEFGGNLLKGGETLDTDKAEAEVVKVAKGMVNENPDMGAIIMECSMLPPYTRAVHEATGLPVYDFINMIDYFQRGSHRKAYSGYY